ncbi:hypothetical protein GALL_427180 [mine drainage metagenome]|uniref:Uncharacterized protein n=1 Tax=mine drainage metagenome TaxID=410659 RepID=A0A1J5PX42_9ZZZZ
MRRRHAGIGGNVVVGVAEIVRHVEDEPREEQQETGKTERVLDGRVGCKRHRILFRLGLDAGRIVLTHNMQCPDVQDHHAGDQERQQIVQREEAVKRRVGHGRPAEEPRLNGRPDPRDSTEQAGDNRCTPERHLAPGQNVSHERRRHHGKVDQHTDDPGHFARGFVAAVVEAAEDVQVDRDEEQRRAVHVHVPDHVAAAHVTHDMLNRGEGETGVRRIVHRQHDTGGDLQDKAEGQDDAPDPHPVKVLRRGDHQRVIKQPNNRQALVEPFLKARLRLVMVVWNSSHFCLLSPA